MGRLRFTARGRIGAGLFLIPFFIITTGSSAMKDTDRYEFLSETDRERLRRSASTEWGRPIVDAMRNAVEERLSHSLEVPRREAGHFHHYFCPVHKRLLDFDWESPTRHYCPECGSYLQGERYDNAWRLMVHNRNARFMRDSALLYVITGDASYLEPVRTLLLSYADLYPGWKIHGHDMQPDAPYGGRMASQSLDEAVWISTTAPACVETRGILSWEEDRRIREGLIRPMAETILRHRVGGNWQVWHNSGIASAAVALEDPDLLKIAIDDPQYGYRAMMATGVTKEGWWSERSPGYHFYPLRAMVLTAEAVRCRGVDLYDERLRSMFVAPMNAVYADLTIPAHNDGWHGVSLVQNAPLYEMAALRYEDERFDRLLARCCARRPRTGWEALLHGGTIEPDPSPLILPSVLYPDTGVAFLRSGPRTVVLKFGAHGGGHGHPDKLSISIHDGRREILPDLGTPGYGVPDHVLWYRRTLAHNTVVVDQRDQRPATGRLVGFEAFPDGGRVAAECDEAYEGVVLKREVRLKGLRLLDVFEASAGNDRLWDYVLLLVDRPPVPDGAEPIELPEGEGYGRLEDPVSWEADEPVVFRTAGAELRLSASSRFRVIAARAPGVPGTLRREDRLQSCYPLILRVSGRTARFEAEWRFPDGGETAAGGPGEGADPAPTTDRPAGGS